MDLTYLEETINNGLAVVPLLEVVLGISILILSNNLTLQYICTCLVVFKNLSTIWNKFLEYGTLFLKILWNSKSFPFLSLIAKAIVVIASSF